MLLLKDAESTERNDRRERRGGALCVLAVALCALCVSSCGPEPTEPADTNLGGTWESNVNMFALEDITLSLVQEPEGVVSGAWTARRPPANCPPPTPCVASGNVIGRNTVAWIELQLTGGPRFEGGLVEANRMRGILAVLSSYDTITFVRR